MANEKTASFVTEIPLRVTPSQEAVLNKRFEAARQVYNACLGESLKRLDLMRESKVWQAARKMPKGKTKTQAFHDINERFGFRKYDLHAYAKQFGHEWLGHHLDSQTVKQLASRAFIWVEQYLFDPKRGRPRFKRYETLNAVESINNQQGIIWRNNQVVWNAGRYGKKLIFDTIIDLNNKVIRHGLKSRIKYVRLVRRKLNGRTRFYAQLVNEGKPYQRFELGTGIAGLDIGPSTVAIVGNSTARLLLFCAELKDMQKEIKKLQRKRDRQQRANNPDNYEPDWWGYPKGQKPRLKRGKIRSGPKRWVKSNKQYQTEQKLAELQRCQAEHRKSLHGHIINQILQMCDTVKLEKLSYRAFQKLFGKSVGMRAPGMFVSRLKQKIDDLGGLVDEFSTYNTKLSQRCHGCGKIAKKPLSQRWHKCECGIVAQRDLYSAFLATCVEDGEFNASLANEQWPGLGSVLRAALDDLQTGDSRALPVSFGLRSRNQLPEMMSNRN